MTGFEFTRGGKTAMRLMMQASSIVILIFAVTQPGFSQLRNLSPYSWDCINRDGTYFVLHETGTADYHWSSEWTHMTVNAYADGVILFVWHFKDGTKAYARQGESVGDLGQITGYLVTDQSQNLQDVHGGKIQPMTRENYPVKVELWIGQIGDTAGFTPGTLFDAVCLNAQTVDYGRPYHFGDCQ
jgi:hypothetical protein